MIKKTVILILFLVTLNLNSQSLNLNESHIIDLIRSKEISGEFKSDLSFNVLPIDINSSSFVIDSSIFDKKKYSPTLISSLDNKFKFKILPIDYKLEYNSHHPYNRNNGSLIPNKGFQNLISTGFFIKIGPLSVQLKPEFVYSENLNFPGFPESHYPIIWAKRYDGWNAIDTPERFGSIRHNMKLLGQSYVKFNYKKLSLGVSNENIWWGPSIRNSIMMSNHARGFKHISFNTTSPVTTPIGNFEWQILSGRLEMSGYTPPNTDASYAGRKLYFKKWNQNGVYDDWRYLQALILNYNPKWIKNLSVGIIRWAQMYSALVEGKYYWMEGSTSYFPLFSNLFRSNDKNVDTEEQVDQAGGIYFKWKWPDAKAEFYGEFHYNDSKWNLRDLLLDSDHASGKTLGLRKVFKTKKNTNYLFSWEWTKLESSAGRLLRSNGSWYRHRYVMHGYTNFGEVLGAGIGPGSNSQYISISQIGSNKKVGLGLEIIEQDNDFNYYAFESAKDFRRYWKDINLHINFSKKFKNLYTSLNMIYSRSLNYQWELEDLIEPYYHAGNDVNNFHTTLNITYQIPIK